MAEKPASLKTVSSVYSGRARRSPGQSRPVRTLSIAAVICGRADQDPGSSVTGEKEMWSRHAKAGSQSVLTKLKITRRLWRPEISLTAIVLKHPGVTV
jgi:hypothetical protein